MDNRRADLSKYRLQEAQDSLRVAEHCLKEGLYKDSINRSYYAAFYSVKAVLALDTVDFKRHKDVMGYFNKNYVATGLFPRDLGRLLGRLKQLRGKSDYDDFYLASKDQASSQYETAKLTLSMVERTLKIINA